LFILMIAQALKTTQFFTTLAAFYYKLKMVAAYNFVF